MRRSSIPGRIVESPGESLNCTINRSDSSWTRSGNTLAAASAALVTESTAALRRPRVQGITDTLMNLSGAATTLSVSLRAH